MIDTAFYIGDWYVEPPLNRLGGPDGAISIEPRTMRVLLQLARATPDVVTREALLEQVWADAMVTEHSLTIAISDLRKLFGDTPRKPAYIETIRGVGYRLIAPVRFPADLPAELPVVSPSMPVGLHLGDGMAGDGASGAGHSQVGTHTTAENKRRGFTSSQVLIPIVCTLLLVALLVVIPRNPSQTVIDRVQPLTTLSGVEISPAFSPDGGRVAFVVFPDSGDVSQIFVQQIGEAQPVRLTNEVGAELLPAWSPDGEHIAYLWHGRAGCALHKIPSFGGKGLKITDAPCGLGGMHWLPDGKGLVVSMPGGKAGGHYLVLVNFDDLAQQQLSFPPATYAGDTTPRFSPDGKTLAFVRAVDRSTRDIYLLDWQTPDAVPVRFTQDGVSITGFDWTSDGDAIVFASNREQRHGLWKASVSGAYDPALIRAVSVDDPGSVVLDQTGRRLVYTDWTYEVNTWRLPLRAETLPQSPAIASTRSDFHPAVSATRRVAFVSTRSGNSEIWVADEMGREEVRLTTMQSQAARFPSWSPDGKGIAFEAQRDGQSDIYVIDAAGGLPHQVTTSSSQESRPSWSRDGQAIYYGSDQSGAWEVWRHNLVTGEAVPVTANGGIAGLESADGSTLYYLRPDTTGIWFKTLPAGPEALLVEADPSFFSLAGDALYYLTPPGDSLHIDVWRYNLAQEEAAWVRNIPVRPLHYFDRWGFAVSPDETVLYFSRVDRSESDLILTEGRI